MGDTPEEDLEKMWGDFQRYQGVDPESLEDMTVAELRRQMQEFFRTPPVVTEARRRAIVERGMRDLGRQLAREFGTEAKATSEGLQFRNQEGQFGPIVTRIESRRVNAPGNWPTDMMEQIFDPRTGRIISQRKL